MGSVTLSIRGLCLVAERATGLYHVLLNPVIGHIPPHIPLLSIPTRFLKRDLGGAARWHPDLVIYQPVVDDNGRVIEQDQVGLWKLEGVEVTFGTPQKKAVWWNRTESIDLTQHYHKGAKILDPAPQGFGVLILGEGLASSELSAEFKVTDPAGVEEKRDVAREIRWTRLPETLTTKDGKTLILEDDPAGNPPAAVVSNLAAVLDGLPHFTHMYDAIVDQGNQKIPYNKQVKLTHAGPEVYDCVPPGG
jgi:hypothetical protein